MEPASRTAPPRPSRSEPVGGRLTGAAAHAAAALLAIGAPVRGGGPAAIKLPAAPSSASAATAPSVEGSIARRRSIREFAPRALTLGEVSALLWAGQGVTGPDGKRAAPSAGALYPLEISLVAGRVAGLPAGVYRYVPASHTLEPRLAGDRRAALAQAAHGQEWIGLAPASIVIAAVPSRTAARYGGRAERYVAIEVGAASENIALESVAIGLGTVFVGAFDDDRVATAAGLSRGEKPYVILPIGLPAAPKRP